MKKYSFINANYTGQLLYLLIPNEDNNVVSDSEITLEYLKSNNHICFHEDFIGDSLWCGNLKECNGINMNDKLQKLKDNGHICARFGMCCRLIWCKNSLFCSLAKLKSDGHICGRLCTNGVKWCKNLHECLMLKEQKEVNHYKLLNHECCIIDSNYTVSYCERTDGMCDTTIMHNNVEKEDIEAEAFGKKLKDEGHKCVNYLQSYPVQISWCRNNPCNIGDH